MNEKLKSPPRVHRFQSSKPLTTFGKPNPTRGRYGAGLIPGVSLCSRGEALGHGAWIDAVMLRQIVDQCNASGDR